MHGHLHLETSKVLNLYLLIAQYPMLAGRIRQRMRVELFQRGIISMERFEKEVIDHAVQSQEREGLTDPLWEESAEDWTQRLALIRDHLTDFYFAYNLPREILVRIISELVNKPAKPDETQPGLALMFNPELAPLEMVLRQAEKYESLPLEQRQSISHHLQELIVVMLKSLISDQLAFIHIAKKWFTSADFRDILAHRIGTGKIGGKAAGLILAYKILENTAPAIFDRITIPRSYFVGADVFYDFLSLNQIEFLNQKYKPADQIQAEYPSIVDTFTSGRFPEEIADRLREILEEVGSLPLIVRSSSLLEDSLGTSFAGKYASIFCPNQGTPKENLRDLTLAIRRVYASVYSPDALVYRRRMGLLDYDERMAILIQEVQGQRHRQYHFPTVAGVAFSYCPITWSPRLRREDGFVRLVMGLGTRAVDRVAYDYPRMIYLSHPQLRPDTTPKAIRYYSQHFVDLIDLAKNQMMTKPLDEVLGADYHSLRWVISIDDGDTIRPPLTLGSHIPVDQYVLTFDSLVQRTDFIPVIKEVLARLADQYHLPVDVEFAVSLAPGAPKPGLTFHLLQCRPQNRSISREAAIRPVPTGIPAEDQIFRCSRMAPQGSISRVEFLVLVDPEKYYALQTPRAFQEVGRIIGRLNKALEGRTFILLGPGRWGSSDALQGVPITYADIFNTRALVELNTSQNGYRTEPSYGTHFFQDLVETEIYPLAISLEDPRDYLNWDFIRGAENQLGSILPLEASDASLCIQAIDIARECPGAHLEVAMDGQSVLGYLSREGKGK